MARDECLPAETEIHQDFAALTDMDWFTTTYPAFGWKAQKVGRNFTCPVNIQSFGYEWDRRSFTDGFGHQNVYYPRLTPVVQLPLRAETPGNLLNC
jgi:hypothetical protein